MTDGRASRPRMATFKVSEEIFEEQGALDASEARRALREALDAIPDEELRNFRGGQITIVS
jgi:hypothetical protein